jgi:hypothetical protein
MGLSPRDRAIIDFERTWWMLPGPKEAAIRDRLEMSGTRYYRLLSALLDKPAAVAYDPLTMRRVRRAREQRRRGRHEGRNAR